MSITVYSTKAIKCKGDSEQVIIPCHEITEVPDWVGRTAEFKMASNDGCLTITNTKKKKLAAENGDLNK